MTGHGLDGHIRREAKQQTADHRTGVPADPAPQHEIGAPPAQRQRHGGEHVEGDDGSEQPFERYGHDTQGDRRGGLPQRVDPRRRVQVMRDEGLVAVEHRHPCRLEVGDGDERVTALPDQARGRMCPRLMEQSHGERRVGEQHAERRDPVGEAPGPAPVRRRSHVSGITNVRGVNGITVPAFFHLIRHGAIIEAGGARSVSLPLSARRRSARHAAADR